VVDLCSLETCNTYARPFRTETPSIDFGA